VVMGNALGGTASYEDSHTTHHQEGADQVSPLVMVNWPVNMISGYLRMYGRYPEGPGSPPGGRALRRTSSRRTACRAAENRLSHP
jgi:hypothetical protein